MTRGATALEAWGEAVGKGWRPIIKPLLQAADAQGVHVSQVKEKFGTLRFYYSGGDERFAEAVRSAEMLSEIVCEDCGDYGKITGWSWVRTLCDPCANKAKEG